MPAVRRVTACLVLVAALAAPMGCAPVGAPEGEDRAGARTADGDARTHGQPDEGTTEPEGTSGTPGADEPDLPAGPTSTASAGEIRARGEALDLGGQVVHALADGGTLTITRPDAHSARLRLSPDGDAPPAVLLALPDGSAVTAHEDGSLYVTLAGASASGSGEAPGVGVAPTSGSTAEVIDGVMRLEPRSASVATDGSSTRPPAEVEAWVGGAAVLSTDWADRTASEGGLSIAVEPAAWARSGGLAGTAAVWSHLERHEPDATGPGMRDQLVCHAVGAPDKATWNLEPWRPDVGLLRTMAARCNPT